MGLGILKEEQHDVEEQEKSYWGDIHPVPQIGTAKRLHIFVQPAQMTQAECEQIKARYWKKVTEHSNAREADESTMISGLSEHLRPSTPPEQRAAQIYDKLLAAGEDPKLVKFEAIRNHFSLNSGLHEALQHYCEGKKQVPVEYASELIKTIDRLKLEFAEQMDKVSGQIRDLKAQNDAR